MQCKVCSVHGLLTATSQYSSDTKAHILITQLVDRMSVTNAWKYSIA